MLAFLKLCYVTHDISLFIISTPTLLQEYSHLMSTEIFNVIFDQNIIVLGLILSRPHERLCMFL